MTETFAIGAEVVVLTLGRKTGVVMTATAQGRYQVRVGSISVQCRADELARPEPSKPKRRGTITTPPAVGGPEPHLSSRIDLHGLTVQEAMAAVLKAIDSAILEGAERLEVVHGKGTGRVKAAIQKELPRVPSVRAVTPDPNNAGVTWVFF